MPVCNSNTNSNTKLLITYTQYSSKVLLKMSQWVHLLIQIWNSSDTPPGITTLAGSTVVTSKQSKMKISYKDAKPMAVNYILHQLNCISNAPSSRDPMGIVLPTERCIQSIVHYITQQISE